MQRVYKENVWGKVSKRIVTYGWAHQVITCERFTWTMVWEVSSKVLSKKAKPIWPDLSTCLSASEASACDCWDGEWGSFESVCVLGEMEGGVQVGVQTAYLDSTSEVCNVHDVSNVLPKVGGEFHHPWSSCPNKKKATAARSCPWALKLSKKNLIDNANSTTGLMWSLHPASDWHEV